MKRLLCALALLVPLEASAQAPLGTAVQNGLSNLPPPEETEIWTPVRKVVPGAQGSAPSDAVDLSSLDSWIKEGGGPAPWKVENGEIVIVPKSGSIQTKEVFGDAQIHLEWMPPKMSAASTGQNRANSGVYIQGLYEVQILESVDGQTYSNGQAGAIYKQHVPLVNPGRPAPQWQTFDIIYTAPRFAADGKLVSPARMTMLFNGVLIHNNAELSGPTAYRGTPVYAAHGPGPLLLQDHGKDRVRFRNIWVRRLD